MKILKLMLHKLVFLIGIFIMGSLFNSCSKDENENTDDLQMPETPEEETITIIGSWVSNIGDETIRLTLNVDNSYIYIENSYYENGTYLYDISEKELSLKYEDEYGKNIDRYTVLSLTKNKLVLKYEDGDKITFTRINEDYHLTIDKEITGKWKQTKGYYQEHTSDGKIIYEEYTTTPDEEWVNFTFNTDGTYLAYWEGEELEKGKFQIKDNYLILSAYGDEFIILELTQKELVLEYRDEESIGDNKYYLQRYYYSRVK